MRFVTGEPYSASSLALLIPALAPPLPRAAFLIFLYIGLATVNVRGVQTGARLMEVLTLAKILPIVLLVVVGAFFVHPVNYEWTSVPSFGRMSSACLVLIFIFMGVEGTVASSGYIPASVGSVNSRTHTPAVAIILEAIVTCGFAISGSFRSLVVLSTVSTLFIYIVTCLAAIQLKRKGVTADGPPFQLRGGPVIPLLACFVIAWMLTGATCKEFIGVGATIIVAVMLYLVRTYYRPTSALES